MQKTDPIVSSSSEFSVQELVETVWAHKIIVIVTTLLTTVILGVAAWLQTKQYTAIAVVAPVANAQSSGQLGALSSIASQFGGLASLAGVGGATDSKKSEALAVLQSEMLTEKYIEANNLLPVLYARDWDRERNSWKESVSKESHSLWQANQFFKYHVRSVTNDFKTGLVNVTITWTDPAIAATWANGLIKMTNDYLRNAAITESERNINYLKDEATKTSIVEARQAIFSLMQTEINKVMLAKGSDEYSFKVLDPATPPEKASSPKKLNWLLVGLFGGLFSSISGVIINSAWKR